MNVGVIGRGFVGGSIEKFLKTRSKYSVKSYDLKDDTDMNNAYSNIVKRSDLIYVCVPTPMDYQGNCYTDIVRGCVQLLNFYADAHKKRPVVLLKSTMVPKTTESFKKEFKNLIFVTNPEFLTERTAYDDLCNSKFHVIGIDDSETETKKLLLGYHNSMWPNSKSIFVTNTQAEMIKYLTNTYFSVKVSFANHIYQLCQAMGMDYKTFIDAAIQSDPRLGELHWNVPGPDGLMGFGGKCFPKDFNGMIKLFDENNVNCEILKMIWKYNVDVRGENDWQKIEGAVCQEQDQ